MVVSQNAYSAILAMHCCPLYVYLTLLAIPAFRSGCWVHRLPCYSWVADKYQYVRNYLHQVNRDRGEDKERVSLEMYLRPDQ